MSSPTDDTLEALPRGPHALTREEVAASQRARLIASFTELLAECGFAAVTLRELAKRASVSRGTFYEQFADKEACLLAAYDEFAMSLLEAMSADVDDDCSWDEFIRATLCGYLGTLEQDPVAARAFVVEMDGGGGAARRWRREAMHGFAAVLAQRHRAIRSVDPTLGELSDRTYLGLAFGVRELVREQLEEEPAPALTELAPDIIAWITATVEGAAAASKRAPS